MYIFSHTWHKNLSNQSTFCYNELLCQEIDECYKIAELSLLPRSTINKYLVNRQGLRSIWLVLCSFHGNRLINIAVTNKTEGASEFKAQILRKKMQRSDWLPGTAGLLKGPMDEFGLFFFLLHWSLTQSIQVLCTHCSQAVRIKRVYSKIANILKTQERQKIQSIIVQFFFFSDKLLITLP